MNFKSLLAGAAMLSAFGASAQTWVSDSVTMNPGYTNDVYYSLQNGTVATPVNTNWHLAFQMTPPSPFGTVTVLANHAQVGVQVYNLHLAASANFSSLAAADTLGKTASSMQLYNADTNWNYGAFNRTTDQANPFNYSWGSYDINTHSINGDSVYLLKVGTTSPVAYKLHLIQYRSSPVDSIMWKFRIAKFDGSDDTTIIIRPADYPNKLFAYYNIDSHTATDREPVKTSWDVMFGRYKGLVTQGGQTQMSNLTGVLSNYGVAVADAKNVNPDTATMAGRIFSTHANAIGYDWKVNIPMTGNYTLDSMRTFFIKTANAPVKYYQMQFTGFSAAAGKSIFRKRGIIPNSIGNVRSSVSAYYAAPNPANNSITLMMDATENAGAASIIFADMTGRTVTAQAVNVVAGINNFTLQTASYPNGVYIISVKGKSINLSQKITIAH